MSHIFISYSKQNIDFVRYLRALLEHEGFGVWVDEARLTPSAKWWKSIEQNIETCSVFIVVMSPDAEESDWVEREILLAEKLKRPIFPILLGTAEGARSIPRQHLDVAAVFGSNERQLWRDVILPYVTPYAMTGIKQSIALTMVGTLVAEFFLNPDGVAALLLQGTTIVNTAWVLAVTVFVAALAVILVGVGELIERVLVRWRHTAVG